MRFTIALFLLLLNISIAKADDWSLFLTPAEIAKIKSFDNAPASAITEPSAASTAPQTLRLNTLVYSDEKNWAATLNGQVYAPSHMPEFIKLITITADQIEIASPIAGQPNIMLQIGQVLNLETGEVVSPKLN